MTDWYKSMSPKAVALGGVVDIVATNLLMLPIVLPLMATANAMNRPAGDRTAALTTALNDRPMLYLAGLLLGSAASILGGWVAARVARREFLLHGALSSWACIGFGLVGFRVGGDAVPVWQHVAFLALSPALGAIGARIYAWQSVRWPRLAAPFASIASETDPALAPLSGAARVVYAVNRAISLVGLLLGTLFGCTLVWALVRHESVMVVGAGVLLVICIGSVMLARAGATHLRAASARHWGFQIASLVLILLPIVAMAVPILASRSR